MNLDGAREIGVAVDLRVGIFQTIFFWLGALCQTKKSFTLAAPLLRRVPPSSYRKETNFSPQGCVAEIDRHVATWPRKT